MRSLRLAAFAAVAFSTLLRVLAAMGASPRAAPDTFDYAAQSRLSLLDPAFWGSLHPPGLPLLWKLVPGPERSLDPVTLGDIRPAVVLNALVAAVCWAALAVAVARLARSRWVGAGAFVTVLALGLAPEVARWDATLLSESASLSLTALAVALALRFVSRPSRGSAVALGAGVLAWVLVRDTNAVFAVLVVGAALVAVRRHVLVLGVALVVAVATSLYGQHAADRPNQPTRNAIAVALLTQPEAPRWFRAHGMPWRRDLPALLLQRPGSRFFVDPRLARFRPWFRAHGRETWYGYLGAHPRLALAFPLRHARWVYDPRLRMLDGYWADDWRSPLPFDPFARGWMFVAVGALAVGAAGAFARRREAVVAVALLAATLPVLLLVWDADALELDRHAIVVPVAARVALLVLAALAVDGFVTRRGSSLPLHALPAAVRRAATRRRAERAPARA